MTPSIRTFLLINLLLSVTLITSLSIIGNLFLEHRDLRDHLDTQLTVTALTIQAFVRSDLDASEIKIIQKHIMRIPQLMKQYYCSAKHRRLTKCEDQPQIQLEKVHFQVWDKNKKMLLYSSSAPRELAFYQHQGFSDRIIEGEPWRVFVTHDVKTKVTVEVAERYAFRDQLEAQITQDSIFIMIITYPFLGLLIWIVVGRGLDSIRRVAQEVRDRAASYLKAVDLEAVPPEIKPLVNELNELFIRLQAAFQREKRFAADAAHELRTPLAALRMQAQVALNSTDDDERREALSKVLRGVDRSTHVVQQLLTLSRMLPDTAVKDTEPVAINKEAALIIADLVPTAHKKMIELELIAPSVPQIILGNATSIGILIRNLVDNAIRYTPDEGRVQIVVEPSRKHVVLKVIDDGPGIPDELKERVFERFFRVVGSKASGSGLGLGIVQQIAQIHKAKIELLTPPSGKGLEVRVTFPKPSTREL